MSKTNKFAIGAFFGIIFGAIGGFITGILTAPKSGKEIREDLKTDGQKVVARGKKMADKVGGSAKSMFSEVKKNFTKKSDDGAKEDKGDEE